MITELLRLSDSWASGPLTGQESYRYRPVHWFIDLDAEGSVLGFSPTAGQEEKRPKRFALPVNYRLGSPNQFNWQPDFLSGPPNEIFPDGVRGGNSDSNKGKQAKWRALVEEAASNLPENRAIRAVAAFVKRNPKFSELPLPPIEQEDRERLLKDFDDGSETVSFRANGHLPIADRELKTWWTRKVEKQRTEIIKGLHSGQDAFLPGAGPVTNSSPTVFGNVPLVSFDKAPFRSYGLGSQTATFRLETVEKAAAVLNALMNDPNTHLQLGDETPVFWAVDRTSGRQISADFLRLLDAPDPLAVRDYLQGIWGSRAPEIAAADFHVAILLKGTGRFSVRSWHTDTLVNADCHVRRYFEAICLPESGGSQPKLRDFAWATIAKARKQKTKPPPATFNALFGAAWRGTSIPFDLLAAALERQRVELASGDPESTEFQARLRARTALVQLYFALSHRTAFLTTSEVIMNAKDTAILCGRLLALLDKIHDVAHDGKSASSPANRLYGAASATPALVFPRLCQLARYHLQKMDGGMARKLEFGVPKDRRDDGVPEDFQGLAAIVAQLKEVSGGDFPRLLSLEDQGRFALGFYYERARPWPNFKKQEQTQNITNKE